MLSPPSVRLHTCAVNVWRAQHQQKMQKSCNIVIVQWDLLLGYRNTCVRTCTQHCMCVCDDMICYVMLCYAMLCDVALGVGDNMNCCPCYNVSKYVMSCCIVLCYDVLCSACMSCYIA